MIPKVKKPRNKPDRISKEVLDKKKINFTTLKAIIGTVTDDKELENRLLSEIENHIRSRNEKRVYSRCISECPEIINEFSQFYFKKYATTSLKGHTFHAGKFIGYLISSCTFSPTLKTIMDCRQITKSMVMSYEEYLVQRMHLGLIQKSTVYRMLYSMKLFLDMLSTLKVIHIRYTIHPSLRAQANRSNEFVNLDEVLVLLEQVEQSKSKLNTRNMSIILLIMELGCRPIEVANLRMDDVRITERLITLRSVKSKTRTLSMSIDLTNMIHEYLKRCRPLFGVDHNMLFITRSGDPITSSTISTMFANKNKNTFDEKRFTSKALRHTYATNALDNKNDFDQVSESMGHKHRCSTEWYIHRSVQRMLSRTLPYNPLNRFEES